MRRLGLTLAAPMIFATIATGLAGCGKSQDSTASADAAAPASAPAASPSDADKKALLARLPAPYNTADVDNGQAKFALCASCHTLVEGGPNMTGPNLYGVFGRKAATAEKFAYSDPMKASGITWDAAKIDSWITDPKAMVPDTKMTFPGLKEAKDRTDVIAYLMLETGFKP